MSDLIIQQNDEKSKWTNPDTFDYATHGTFIPVDQTILDAFGSTASLAFGRVWGYCRKYGHCWASEDRIAREIGVTRASAAFALKVLHRFRLLKVIGRGEKYGTILRVISLDSAERLDRIRAAMKSREEQGKPRRFSQAELRKLIRKNGV